MEQSFRCVFQKSLKLPSIQGIIKLEIIINCYEFASILRGLEAYFPQTPNPANTSSKKRIYIICQTEILKKKIYFAGFNFT